MAGKGCEHVVKKADARVDVRFSCAREGEGEINVGFRGFALDVCGARGHWYVPFLSGIGEYADDLVVFVSKAGTFDCGDVDVAVLPAIDAGVYGGFGE